MDSIESIDFTAMKNVDIRAVEPDTLIDINDIRINTKLPKEERITDFIGQIKNPYCFKCGKAIVKVSFAKTEITLEERIENYIRTL